MKGGRFPLGALIPKIVPTVPIRKKQKGGVIPLAAVVPGLMAAGKTAGLAALGAVVGQKTKQWMKKKNKRKTLNRKHQKGKNHARR